MNDTQSESSIGKHGRLRKGLTAILGGLVLLVGIVAIPYPGPGWLIVFAGLAILSREFPWAKRILSKLRTQYDKWNEWRQRQSVWVQALFFLLTTILVVVTLYLINAYGLMLRLFNIEGFDWLESPFI